MVARPDVVSTDTTADVILPYLIARRFARSLRIDAFARFTAIVSIASVAIGCIALVVAMSILGGYEEAIRSTAMRFSAPIELRSLSSPLIDNVDHLESIVRSIPGVEHVDRTLTREALGRTRHGVDGIMLLGVSDHRAHAIVAPMLIDGKLSPRDTGYLPTCVVGLDVARRLGLRLNDTLVIYTAEQHAALTPILAPIVVSGIMRSGMQQYDETAVFVHEAALRHLLRLDASATSAVTIDVDPRYDIDDVARTVGAAVGPRILVQTYKQKFNAVETWIALQKEPIPIILGLISIVALFTVVATLLIAVVEKTRQIAVLRTLGMTTRAVASVFMWQGLRVGIIGCAIGCVVSFAFCLAQDAWQFIRLDGAIYYVSALPVSFDAFPYILVACTSVATSLLASLVPVMIASRIDPVRMLQFR